MRPITARGELLLGHLFRHPVRMWMRELPRGARESGESPEEAARRELMERSGARPVV
ncbi:MAG: NUDIX domain-containing protein [Pseudomonadota bacterium]|nr:NUDIX domain-containing protein [Pseudomonadota bacterium]